MVHKNAKSQAAFFKTKAKKVNNEMDAVAHAFKGQANSPIATFVMMADCLRNFRNLLVITLPECEVRCRPGPNLVAR